MLCAFFSVNSCDECITTSHRILWTVCEPGQNIRNCSRVYEERVLMWIVSLSTLAHYLVSLGEVILSVTGNITGIPCVLYSHAYNFIMLKST